MWEWTLVKCEDKSEAGKCLVTCVKKDTADLDGDIIEYADILDC